MNVDAERWRSAKRLFQEAIEQEEAMRAGFLDVACAADAELRAEVGSLLAAYAEARDRFEESPLARAAGGPDENADGETTPERIGPYRLLRELGRGGMGTVYLGQRDGDELAQPVAIKVIRRGMDSEAIVRRFRNERRILASLHHPSIARLYEGGTTEAGLPFFVMEFIEGEPLDDFCGARELSVDERLRLFQQVCAAVQYAHQNLVVHRDLKPGNILVTAAGVPKLLDFGIAKLLDAQEEPGAPDLTALDRPMTPDYASPEQVRGDAMSTVSDVFSLGVVLYQLLTGQLPHRFTTGSAQEVLRVLDEQAPERPSAAAGRAVTGTPERRTELRRRLAGDLDNIVLMALHVDPARRYPSAEQLAEDIQRHLTGFPVRARPDALGYRVRKFVWRHRLGVVATSGAALALIATTGLALWQARLASIQRTRAEARFDDVRQLARSVIFEMHDAIAALPGSTSARQLLVTRALEYLDDLAREASGLQSLQRELANAYDRVADVQGLPTAPSLGDLHGALATYRKAQDVRARLLSAGMNDPELRRELSATSLKLAVVLLYAGEPAAGAEEAGRSAEIEEALAASDPTEPQRVRLGRSYVRHGYLLGARGETRASLERLRSAIALLEPVAAAGGPEASDASDVLSTAYTYLAEILQGGQPVPGVVPDLPGALAVFRKVLALDETLLRAEPESVGRRRAVMVDHVQLGDVSERAAEPLLALEEYRQALALVEALSATDPADVQARSDLGLVSQRIGTILAQQGDPKAGAPHLERALRLLEEVAGKDPASAMTRARLAETHAGLGHLHAAFAGDESLPPAQRVDHLRRARARFEQSLAFWTEARARGSTTGEESAKPDMLAEEIARCDRALAELAAAGG